MERKMNEKKQKKKTKTRIEHRIRLAGCYSMCVFDVNVVDEKLVDVRMESTYINVSSDVHPLNSTLT